MFGTLAIREYLADRDIGKLSPTTVSNTLGRDAVPMFFWGGEGHQGVCAVGIVLNPMGVWRDSVRSQYNEETGACRRWSGSSSWSSGMSLHASRRGRPS
jgi:hypothetical protein